MVSVCGREDDVRGGGESGGVVAMEAKKVPAAKKEDECSRKPNLLSASKCKVPTKQGNPAAILNRTSSSPPLSDRHRTELYSRLKMREDLQPPKHLDLRRRHPQPRPHHHHHLKYNHHDHQREDEDRSTQEEEASSEKGGVPKCSIQTTQFLPPQARNGSAFRMCRGNDHHHHRHRHRQHRGLFHRDTSSSSGQDFSHTNHLAGVRVSSAKRVTATMMTVEEAMTASMEAAAGTATPSSVLAGAATTTSTIEEDSAAADNKNETFVLMHSQEQSAQTPVKVETKKSVQLKVASENGCGGGDANEDRLPPLAAKKKKPFLVCSFEAYSQETTLHGWKYVTSPSSNTIEKMIWLLLLLAGLTTASVLVYQAVSEFVSMTVTTNMESLTTSFEHLYFPAITICNMNFIQRSVLEKYNLQYNDSLIDIFDRMINIGTAENFTSEEIRMFEEVERMTKGADKLKREGTPQCDNMFLQYSWKNRDVDFGSGKFLMHYGQTTDESVCCQIFPGLLPSENDGDFDIHNNSFWGTENPWQVIFDGYKRGIKPGKQGVQVLVDVETFEYFSVHSKGSEGVMVLIQHYRDIPLMRKESFILTPGVEVDVGLSITEITTSTGAIERFAPNERDCYTDDEVNLVSLPLKKGYRMSMMNCLYDKALHATKAECNCIPPFYTLGALGKLPTCKGTQLYCAYRIFDDVVEHRPVVGNNNATKCRAPCDDQLYNSRIAFASYPNRALFWKRPEVAKLVTKLLKICTGFVNPNALYQDELKIKKNVLLAEYPRICENLSNLTLNSTWPEIRRELRSVSDLYEDVYNYARRNLLWLNVYVKDSFATRIVRDERMTRTNFVANVGGLLGLCMGFSLVSVAEIIYFGLRTQARPFKSRFARRTTKRKALRTMRTRGGCDR